MDLPYLPASSGTLLPSTTGCERLDRVLAAQVESIWLSAAAVQIAQAQLEQEAVELGLGQRERALVLDRVLRRQHHEGAGQGRVDAVHRHLALAHALQQRGLRARRGAVDLVGQQDVGEGRAGDELELAACWL